MGLARLGSTITLNQFNERFSQTVLSDGRVAVAGPLIDAAGGQNITIYSASGEKLQEVPVNVIDGLSVLASLRDIQALANGGFVVSGHMLAMDGNPQKAGFVVFDANGVPQPYTNAQGLVRYAHPVFDIWSYGGVAQAGSMLAALPDGRFVMAWTTDADNQAQGATGIGINNDGRPIFSPGTFAPGTDLDVRVRYFNADGTPSGPELIATQGIVDMPTYDVYSRYGSQSLIDLDVLADGRVVISYLGDRFSAPHADGSQLASNPYKYASLRVLSQVNDGTSNTILVGETPFTATPSSPHRTTASWWRT